MLFIGWLYFLGYWTITVIAARVIQMLFPETKLGLDLGVMQ